MLWSRGKCFLICTRYIKIHDFFLFSLIITVENSQLSAFESIDLQNNVYIAFFLNL